MTRIAVVCLAAAFSWNPNTWADDDSSLEKVHAAYAAAATPLEPVRGKGTFQARRAGELVVDAKFTFVRAGTCYRMDIAHNRVRESGPQIDRVLLVCDGKALYVNWFSPRMRPAGCELSVFDLNRSTFRIAARGVGYNPTELVEVLLGSAKQFADRDVTLLAPMEKKIRGRYALGERHEVVFAADPEVGHNVTEVIARRVDAREKQPFAVYEADWKRTKAGWFCKGISANHQRGDGVTRYEMSLADVEVGARVPDSLFRLDALEPCDGSRVIDRRPGAKRRILQYRNLHDEFDEIAEEVDALPERGLRSTPEREGAE